MLDPRANQWIVDLYRIQQEIERVIRFISTDPDKEDMESPLRQAIGQIKAAQTWINKINK